MKKNISLFLLAMMVLTASAFAADWDANGGTAKKEDKAAVARNLSALAKKPEALRAAANIAKIRMKQKEDAKRLAAGGQQ